MKKVRQLRLDAGCYALGNSDNIIESDRVKITLEFGNFTVDMVGKQDLVWIPGSQVRFALLERDEKKK
jgi:hypothetical protein